jgi:nucleotide-binding universal stress UspA family protein
MALRTVGAMKTVILHPSDFSAASRPAFEKAIEMAKTNRATLELLLGSVASRVISRSPCPVLTVRGK